MKTIDEIYQIVEESSHETAFNRGEVEGLMQFIRKIPNGGIAVEIGVQFGRSTSVFAELQKEKPFEFSAIDNWSELEGGKQMQHVLDQKKKHDWVFNLLSCDSLKVEWGKDKEEIDLLFIDGDHSYKGVSDDINHWAPVVKCGGYMLFDDYEHIGLEEVTDAIKDYMKGPKGKSWLFIGKFGSKLGVFQRI